MIKVKCSILIFYIFLNFCSYAQTQKFGKIDKESFKMKTYAKDTSANAVVLFDVGKSWLSYKPSGVSQINFERHTRIKILNKNGYKHANISIPYFAPKGYSGDHILHSVKAYTYKLNNGNIEKIKLEKDAIFERRISEGFMEKKFTMPSVDEGVIIEYSYKIISNSIRTWYFQGELPIIWSEYTVSLPEYFTYQINRKGYAWFQRDKPKTRSTENYIINIEKWYAEDMPVFKPEKYVANPRDHLAQVGLRLTKFDIPGRVHKDFGTTWERFAKALMKSEDFGNQLNKKGAVEDIIGTTVKENQTSEEKARIIYDYVTQNIKWNQVYGISSHQGVRQTLSDKKGNVGDINILLTLLMREVGLEAHPVLISTRGHGEVILFNPEYSIFNYVIVSVEINGNIIFLDASQNDLPFGILPYHCLNGKGLQIQGLEGEREEEVVIMKWLENVNSSIKSSYNNTTILELTEDGQFVGNITLKMQGLEAVQERAKVQKKGKEEYLKSIWNEDELGMTFQKQELVNIKDKEKPFKIVSQVQSSETNDEDLIYFNPFLDKTYEENPFKLEERKYPVDFGHPFQKLYTLVFTLPDNYTVEELPKNINFTSPDKSIQYSQVAGSIGKSISIRVSYSVNKPVFIAKEYTFLKEMINLIIENQSEQIVLKKIK